jgi:MFS family permease
MTDQFGWRSLFLINVPLLVVSWMLQPRIQEEQATERSRRFEWRQSVRIWGTLFQNRAYLAAAGVVATQNMAMYSLLVQVPFLFGGGDGSDAGLGLAIIAMTFTMAATSPLGGWLVEWLGVKAVIATGGLIAAVGLSALGALPSTASARQVGMRLLLVGVGLGLSTAPANASAISAVPQEQSAVASAMVSMLRYVGAIFGTVVLSFALAPGPDGTTRQHVALWVFVGALIVSVVLGLTLPPLPGRRSLGARANARAN